MKYVGIQTQIWRNNRNTVILLFMFPLLLLGMVLGTIMLLDWFGFFCWNGVCPPGLQATTFHWKIIWRYFLDAMPFTLSMTAIWFIIAYFANVSIIRHATHARPLERKENVRVYNIVENLCIAGGIEMPQINIVDDPSLNAFASGIDIKSYTITLTTGIIDKLDDAELSAVVGHELTHIKNRDTRLMVVCIVFVGIFSMMMHVITRILANMWRMPRRRSRKNDGAGAGIVLVLIVLLVWAAIGYFFSTLTRLAISRKREYVADAGGAELCGDPLALASALRKISADPGLAFVQRSDIAQLYVIHPDEEDDNDSVGLKGLVAKANILFCTHPDTPERIRLLEQF